MKIWQRAAKRFKYANFKNAKEVLHHQTLWNRAREYYLRVRYNNCAKFKIFSGPLWCVCFCCTGSCGQFASPGVRNSVIEKWNVKFGLIKVSSERIALESRSAVQIFLKWPICIFNAETRLNQCRAKGATKNPTLWFLVQLCSHFNKTHIKRHEALWLTTN